MDLTVSWLTIISFILNLVLAGLGLYQYIDSKEEEENTKSKVKLWQKAMEGLKNGLLGVAMNPNNYTNKNDVASAVQSLAQVASSLDESFVKERFYSEGKVKAKREKAEEERKELFNRLRQAQQKNKVK